MRLTPILVLAATLAFVASPLFVTSFAGIDPDLYPVPQVDPPIQPAGWAFSIWGLIYAWLVAHAVWGLWKHADDPAWEPARWPLVLSLGPGAFWLWTAEVNPVWATLLIFWMLVWAVVALFRSPEGPGRWLRVTPVALYAGWLSAASFAALGLLGAGWGVAMGETGWAFLCIALALIVATGVQLRLGRTPDYALPVAWAFTAIAAKNAGSATGVALAAGAAALVMLALAAVTARR